MGSLVSHDYDPDALHAAEAQIARRLSGSTADIEVQRAISNIYRAATVVSRRAEREMLDGLGLSWSAFVSLWVLWVWGEMDATRLASEVGLTPGTVTGVRKGLEKDGLIASRRDSDDGRKVLIRLTEHGEQVFDDFYPKFNEWSVDIFADLSPSSTSELADLLEHVIVRPAADRQPPTG